MQDKIKAYITRAKTNPIEFLATGFYSGHLPNFPGTWGTVAAIPLFLILSMLPGWLYFLFVIAAFVIGVYICDETARALNTPDHPSIVWDEFVGFWITMMGAHITVSTIFLGFLLFRLFDIWKPWPVNYFDQNVEGGMGIMLDDVVAGIYALVFLQIFALFIPV